jgi:glycosyltransferase involved in cell wall biosynthesis
MAAFAGTRSTFLGALSGVELAAAYASADVFVFPSTTDTLGLVLLEAMASGLPVVAAETPEAADMLGSSIAGALFEADDPRALRAAVDRWTHAAPNRMEIAAVARSSVVSWRQSTDQLVAWYVQASSRSERSTAA